MLEQSWDYVKYSYYRMCWHANGGKQICICHVEWGKQIFRGTNTLNIQFLCKLCVCFRRDVSQCSGLQEGHGLMAWGIDGGFVCLLSSFKSLYWAALSCTAVKVAPNPQLVLFFQSVMNRIHTISVPYSVMKACPLSWVQRVHVSKGLSSFLKLYFPKYKQVIRK